MTAPAPRRSSGASFVDAVPFLHGHGKDPLRNALDGLLTRSFYSAAGYVFESEPYTVPEDGPLLEAMAAIRLDDRRHAHVLGGLVQARGGVPQPAVFPFWDLDLNYLSVPYLVGFVRESIAKEVTAYDALVAAWPADDAGGRAALEAIRNDKREHVARLGPLAEAGRAREAATYAERIVARDKARAARIAKEKAAAEAAKKAKAAAGRPGAAPVAAKPAAAAPVPAASAAALDPNEPGISPKEKARRTMARMRGGAAPAAAPAGAAAPAAAVAPAALGGDLGDPNEPGISPKEKARRTMARMRGAGAAPAAAAAPAAPAAPAAAAPSAPLGADLGDPDEPGISPKEKAKRKVARLRAAGGGPVGGAPAPAAAAAPAPAQAAPAAGVEPLAADLGDPDEPGLSPKEKARRKVARLRAAGGRPVGGAPAPAAAAAAAAPAPAEAAAAPAVEALPEDLGDPDEPGLSPKEKARRKVARMRAQRGG